MPDESTLAERSAAVRDPRWRMVVAATVEGAVLAALIEVCLRILVPELTDRGLRNVNPHAVWLSPLANAALLLPLTTAVAGFVLMFWRRLVGALKLLVDKLSGRSRQ